MIERAVEDRRVKNNKIKKDNRVDIRRDKDKKFQQELDYKSYYLIVAIIGFILVIMGIVSFTLGS